MVFEFGQIVTVANCPVDPPPPRIDMFNKILRMSEPCRISENPSNFPDLATWRNRTMSLMSLAVALNLLLDGGTGEKR